MIIINNKNYTQDYIKNAYKEKGYELISEYHNVNSKLYVIDNEGYVCASIWCKFEQGREPNKFHKSNPYTIQNIKLWMKTNAIGYELLSTEYKSSDKDKLLFKCPKCSNKFPISWSKFKQGERCPYCCNPPQRIELGINTIWDTDKWMCDLGVSEEDAKSYSKSSGKKIRVKCPNCGKEKYMTPNKIYSRRTISCICNYGVSFSEKFIVSLLDQLEIEYIKEYVPNWSNNKRYDFYIKDYNMIIECHGRQHYDYTGFNRSLREEQENDKYKQQLAYHNGINEYIVLDCRKSNLDWIKNSILNSELSTLFNLDDIDWSKCEEFATSNLVKQVCDYWNQKEECETTTDVAKEFKLSSTTIKGYLKFGNELNWCIYNAKEEMGKINKYNLKKIEVFKNGISQGIFNSALELENKSYELFGVKIKRSKIYDVCNSRRKSYKGYTFKYIEKIE